MKIYVKVFFILINDKLYCMYMYVPDIELTCKYPSF